MRHPAILITGGTGLIGGAVLRRLLERDRELHAYLLVRNATGWPHAISRLRIPASRVTALPGDVTRPGLGLPADVRAELAESVRLVVHAAADTVFSRPLALARAVNRDGTRHVVEVADEWRGVERYVHVSTAFVAGRTIGEVPEREHPGDAGFVNAYEQSKHEAEAIVRASSLPWLIARPSTVVCESEHGDVRQVNAVHRALALQHAGLAALLPGTESSPVDLVTTDFVAESIARLCTTSGAVERGTFHLCAGAGAIRLGELLDLAHATWSRSESWRRRGVARPALADLDTWALFQRSVEETGDARLRRITRALSHFAPQLALPKRFRTEAAVEATGLSAAPVRAFLARVLDTIAARRSAAGELTLAATG